MPTESHEEAQANFGLWITTKLMAFGVPQWDVWQHGATTHTGTSSAKQGDYSIKPRPERAQDDFPSFGDRMRILAEREQPKAGSQMVACQYSRRSQRCYHDLSPSASQINHYWNVKKRASHGGSIILKFQHSVPTVVSSVTVTFNQITNTFTANNGLNIDFSDVMDRAPPVVGAQITFTAAELAAWTALAFYM